MIDILQSWNGAIEIDGTLFHNKSELPKDLILRDNMCIVLRSNEKVSACQAPQASTKEYKVEVRQYMLKQATADFDFMKKWNNDVPMPLRVMVGTVEKETRGMVYMNLHGDILEERTQCCMKCGRPITNPVSQYFGMGPECGSHGYVNPFNSDTELREAVSNYKKQLRNMTWSGWIIRSAITNMEEV